MRICGVLLSLALLLVSGQAAGTTPEQIHLAYAGRDPSTGYPTGMTVSWATETMPNSPVVSFGTSSKQYTDTQKAITVQYFDTYFHHHAVIDTLQSGTKYFFTVGDAEASVKSDEFSFTTAKNTADVDLTVVVIGDMGVGKNSVNTMARLAEAVPKSDLLWHIGDISYADDAFLDHPFTFDYEVYWNQYMNEVQNFTAFTPYMVLPGNHEAECHSPACDVSSDRINKLANFSAYNHRFRMPSDVSDGVMNMWYSFNVGPIHFVNIDTETDYPGAPGDHYDLGPGNGGFGDQLTWLKNDLEQAQKDRSIRPWVIIGGHRPVYSVTSVDKNGNPSGAAKTLQTAIEEMMSQYKVDIYIAGHIHGYERHQSVYQSKVTTDCSKSCSDPENTIYIIDGGAGNVENLTKYSGTPPSWNVAYNFKDFGYAVMSTKASANALSADTLTWSYYTDSGELFDSFTLQKTAALEYIA
jgi:hypothetical protein